MILKNLIIQLKTAVNFIPSKDKDEERVMNSKKGNVKIMINDKVDKVTKELFQSLLSGYQIGLKASMYGSEVVFDYVQLLYHNCHKKSKLRWIIYS